MSELAPYTPPGSAEIDYTWNLANKLCKTEFVPSNLRNRPEAILAVFLTGRELGIGPMQSLRDIYPVNGRPALMATLMVARVRGLGHRFKTLESTDTSATVQVHRKGESGPEPPIEFTLADAKRADLTSKAVWRQYPKAMLWNRAASAACRRDCPEALGGAVYTPEELGDGTTTATWGTPEASEQSDPGSRTGGVGSMAPGDASVNAPHSPGSDPTSGAGEADERPPNTARVRARGLVAERPAPDPTSDPEPRPTAAAARTGSDPTKSPPTPSQEAGTDAGRGGVEGANHDGMTQPDAGAPPTPDVAPPPEPFSPGGSGGTNRPTSGGANSARAETSVRGRQRKPRESDGVAAGRDQPEEAEQAAFEQGQAERDPGKWTR